MCSGERLRGHKKNVALKSKSAHIYYRYTCDKYA